LAAGGVDQVATGLRLRRRQLLQPAELTLELVRIRSDRVQPDHLDRTGGLVNVGPGVLERSRVSRRGLERRERFDAARQRLVDFTLNPGERAEIEFRDGVCNHGAQGFARYSEAASKKRASAVRYTLRAS